MPFGFPRTGNMHRHGGMLCLHLLIEIKSHPRKVKQKLKKFCSILPKLVGKIISFLDLKSSETNCIVSNEWSATNYTVGNTDFANY